MVTVCFVFLFTPSKSLFNDLRHVKKDLDLRKFYPAHEINSEDNKKERKKFQATLQIELHVQVCFTNKYYKKTIKLNWNRTKRSTITQYKQFQKKQKVLREKRKNFEKKIFFQKWKKNKNFQRWNNQR